MGAGPVKDAVNVVAEPTVAVAEEGYVSCTTTGLVGARMSSAIGALVTVTGMELLVMVRTTSYSIDPTGKGGGPATNNSGRRYTWATYPEALQSAGVTWRIYRPETDYGAGLDVIMNFAAFQDAPTTSPLYENARKVRSSNELLADIRSGNLPQVTWIVPPYARCEHPNMLAAAGEDYVRYLLEAFWSNPATWARTAFIIVYDENDGLFDHVVPPTPPPGPIQGQPIRAGPHLPTA